ncbi:MAG: heavy metal translocating P-type ATPase [bacterium]
MPEKKTVKVGGMHCATCVSTVEKSLKKLDGTIDVVVNLSTEEAHITYEPQKVSIKDLKSAIEDAGYEYLGTADDTTGELAEKYRTESLKKMRLRIIIGFIAGIPLMVLMYLPLHHIEFPIHILLFIISTPVFIYLVYPIFIAGFKALKNKNLNMDVMYSMGIGVAFIASVMGTFNIILNREFLFYETAILLATFLTLGRYLETNAKGKTSEAIKKLMGLQPKSATVIRNGDEIEIPIQDLSVGDVVMCKPGQRIPTDGEVIEGMSLVDESMVTGEPLPVLKKTGDKVIGGTINKNSVLKFRATKVGKDTLLAQIIKLIQEAQTSKPPVQKLADRVVNYFIPVVLGIAIISFCLWYFAFGTSLHFALTTLISVLVIACPCALGLATPTAITVGIGRGAELGILIKNGDALEVSEKINTMVLDKTGTLTSGKPEVVKVMVFDKNEKEVMKIAASIEKNSIHPLAEAIVEKALSDGIELIDCKDFETIEGRGVKATIDDKHVFIGNKNFMLENNVAFTQNQEAQIAQLEKQGASVVLVSLNNYLIGAIGIADTLKSTTRSAIEEIKKIRIKPIMVTGDNLESAKIVGKAIGIEEIIANVYPQDKAEIVKKLQKNGEIVAFVGDGINDAPALAQADLGIAIGSGTDIAIESGDIVLVKGEIIDAVAGIQLGRKVISRIKQNLFWAFFYNIILIPVAAGVLYPFFRIGLKPEFAGLAMAMSSVTVVSLSLMLKRYIPQVIKDG